MVTVQYYAQCSHNWGPAVQSRVLVPQKYRGYQSETVVRVQYFSTGKNLLTPIGALLESTVVLIVIQSVTGIEAGSIGFLPEQLVKRKLFRLKK